MAVVPVQCRSHWDTWASGLRGLLASAPDMSGCWTRSNVGPLIHTIGDAGRQQGRTSIRWLLMFVRNQLSQGAPTDQVFA
jgi:hypothetical protein